MNARRKHQPQTSQHQALAVSGKVEEAQPQHLQVVPMSESASLMQMILRAATDPKVDMDKMERLMVMHKELKAQQAEQEFNAALSAAQTNMVKVKTNRKNTQTGSDYADYAAIDRMARPLYSAEGLALSFNTEPGAPEGEVRVVCYASHRAGHTKKYQIDMPCDGKGAKGGDVMTKTHAMGSAFSYGKRYLVQGIFNIATGKKEDDDGNKAGGFDQHGRPFDSKNATNPPQQEQPPELSPKEQALKRRQQHDAALGRHIESMDFIRALIKKGDLEEARKEWAAIQPQADQMALWLATDKGGWFTTSERKVLSTAAKPPEVLSDADREILAGAPK